MIKEVFLLLKTIKKYSKQAVVAQKYFQHKKSADKLVTDAF